VPVQVPRVLAMRRNPGPLESIGYELQILQALCFDIHTKCPGCTPPGLFPGKPARQLAVNSARESTSEKDKGGIHGDPRGVGDNLAK